MKMKTLFTGFVLGIAAWMMVGNARAAALVWTNTAGGTFATDVNWAPNFSPLPDTDVYFTNSIPGYTVTLGASTSVTQFWGSAGTYDMTFDVNGYSFIASRTNNSASFVVATVSGANATMVLKSSQPGGVLSPALFTIGTHTAATANVTFTGSNLTAIAYGTLGDNTFFSNGSGTLTMSDGVTVSSARAYVFGAGSATANPLTTWIITDPGTKVTNTSASPLYVGKTGTNMPTMVISNGAGVYLTGASAIARIGMGGDATSSYNKNTNAKLIVSGTNSLLYSTSLYLSVHAGNGVLTKSGYSGTAGGFAVVENGGKVDVAALYLCAPYSDTAGLTASNKFAYGELVIRDPGSVVTARTSAVQIGRVSQGAMYVLNGGLFTTAAGVNTLLSTAFFAGTTTTFTNTDAYSLLVISNAGSRVETRALFVGGDVSANSTYGYGDVIVADNGHLKTVNTTAGITLRSRSSLMVSDALVESQTLVMESNTTLRIELGARDHANAYIQLAGTLSLDDNVTLELSVADDFSASYGDTIRLIAMSGYGGASGVFANIEDTDVVHIGSYDFEYQEWGTYIALQAIPEPGTVGLIGAGMGLAALLRRRARKD